jgi:hypothetical protein
VATGTESDITEPARQRRSAGNDLDRMDFLFSWMLAPWGLTLRPQARRRGTILRLFLSSNKDLPSGCAGLCLHCGFASSPALLTHPGRFRRSLGLLIRMSKRRPTSGTQNTAPRALFKIGLIS